MNSSQLRPPFSASFSVLYFVVCLWVILGASVAGPWSLSAMILAYMAAWVACLFVLKWLDPLGTPSITRFWDAIQLSTSTLDKTLYGLTMVVLPIVMAHYVRMGQIPLWTAWNEGDYYEIVFIRQNIPDLSGTAFNYISSVLIKAVFPFMLVATFHRRLYKLHAIVYLIAAFYCLSLIQKSFIVVISVSPILYLLWRRKFIVAAAYCAVIVFSVGFLVVATNPSLKPAFIPQKVERSEESKRAERLAEKMAENSKASTGQGMRTIAIAVLDRVALVPGTSVADWYRLIPSQIPFANGCGYRFLVGLLKCDHYQFTQLEVYKVLNPDLTKMGIFGSINVASFMEDYANFGKWFIAVSAPLIAILLYFMGRMFARILPVALPMNFVFIATLSSASLFTTLLSGGWFFTILMLCLFGRAFEEHVFRQPKRLRKNEAISAKA